MLSAAFQCTKEVWPSKSEDDVCLWPVLEKWPTQRGWQKQEVLLSQGTTHVSVTKVSNMWIVDRRWINTSKSSIQYIHTNWGPVFVSQVGERQAGGACKFPWKEKVDNSQTTSNQKTHPVSVRGTCPTFSHFYPKIDCFLTETNFHQCLPNNFSSSDLHARDSWQKVSVHRELHVCSQRRRKRPLDLHEGKQQWVCQGDWLRSLVEFN